MRSTKKLKAGRGDTPFIALKGALVGFALGLIFAVPAGAWVWLEMRVNVGILIPVMTIVCGIFALWKKRSLPYVLFLGEQVLLIVVLTAIYGFNTGALWAVPAYLFREGFHCTGLSPGTAGLTAGGIFIGGNFLWIAFGNCNFENIFINRE